MKNKNRINNLEKQLISMIKKTEQLENKLEEQAKTNNKSQDNLIKKTNKIVDTTNEAINKSKETIEQLEKTISNVQESYLNNFISNSGYNIPLDALDTLLILLETSRTMIKEQLEHRLHDNVKDNLNILSTISLKDTLITPFTIDYWYQRVVGMINAINAIFNSQYYQQNNLNMIPTKDYIRTALVTLISSENKSFKQDTNMINSDFIKRFNPLNPILKRLEADTFGGGSIFNTLSQDGNYKSNVNGRGISFNTMKNNTIGKSYDMNKIDPLARWVADNVLINQKSTTSNGNVVGMVEKSLILYTIKYNKFIDLNDKFINEYDYFNEDGRKRFNQDELEELYNEYREIYDFISPNNTVIITLGEYDTIISETKRGMINSNTNQKMKFDNELLTLVSLKKNKKI